MRSISFLMLLALTAPSLAEDKTEPPPAVQNEELRRELRAMFAEDQQARAAWLKAIGDAGFSFENPASNLSPRLVVVMLAEQRKMAQQDAASRRRLKEIISKHGWPGKSLVGAGGANAAWLLVQHADADVAFQKECLALMEAAPQGEISPKDVAYLTDRVLVNEGKNQRYGTQLGMNFEPRPLEDPEKVDELRAEVGLPPLAKYVKDAREQYNKMLKPRAE